MHVVRFERAEFDEFLDFGDDVVGCGGHHGIKVPRGLAVDEIAPAVTLPRFDECEIAANAALHHILATIEFARLFAFGDHRAVSGWSVEGGDSRPTRTDSLGKRALWI